MANGCISLAQRLTHGPVQFWVKNEAAHLDHRPLLPRETLGKCNHGVFRDRKLGIPIMDASIPIRRQDEPAVLRDCHGARANGPRHASRHFLVTW